MNNRVARWVQIWYQPELKMNREEYCFILVLSLVALWAFAIGVLVGCLWAYYV